MKDKIPLIDIRGSAFECGSRYAEIVKEKYPGYTRYTDMAFEWKALAPSVKKLVENKAPFLIDLYRGIIRSAGTAHKKTITAGSGCTSFGISGEITLDGCPLSGQNKDTAPESSSLYIVLKLRIKDGPVMLVMAYPGEVLGYGMWSTGMSLFRNNLFSSKGSKKGLTFVQFGLLALSGNSVYEAAEIAEKYGIKESGNVLLSDCFGKSLSVEFNAGGVDIIEPKNGIITHANHPAGKNTGKYEDYPDKAEKKNSRYRAEKLFEDFESSRGKVTVEKTFKFLSGHKGKNFGLCRHRPPDNYTTASIIAEQSKGKLHVIRGNPCSNTADTYSI